MGEAKSRKVTFTMCVCQEGLKPVCGMFSCKTGKLIGLFFVDLLFAMAP